MSDSATSDRIAQTQNAFPDQPAGAVVPCPQQQAPAPAPTPAQIETAFEMTQQIMKTLSGTKPAEKQKQKKAWIEIILVDAEGNPMPGVRYRITPPGGEPVEGTLNEHGQAGLYQIEPGNCKVTFPDLDKDAWE